MVYTVVPPDNCGNDALTSLQHTHLGVNSMEKSGIHGTFAILP
jgi:hypothetical protein